MYIPISNIVSNGYTNGGEFALRSSLQPYVGFYFTDKNNNVYTGQTWSVNSVELIKLNPTPLQNSVLDPKYASLNPKTLPPLSITPDFAQPVESDYKNGYFIRYFLKPVISSQINDFIEVKSDKYSSVIDNKDARVLYNSARVTWKLTGPLYDIYKDNIRINSGIIDTNKRSISNAEKTLPNISLYLTDPLQFGRPS